MKLDPRVHLYLASGTVFLLDRASKFLIENYVTTYDTYTVIPGLFQIVHTRNKGIAFGLFNDDTSDSTGVVLIVFSLIVLAFIASMLWQSSRLIDTEHWSLRVGLALILGGALGNVCDRVFQGAVTDFLDFFWRDVHFPAFNVADSAITVGAALVLLNLWIGRRASRAR